MSKYVLLTGATGLVGRYLLRDLLLRGVNLALVLRPTEKETIQERVEGILQFWEKQLGKTLPRPVCWEGDVSEPNLGLSDEAQQWVETHCDSLIHNAAVLVFYGSDRAGEPWRTNLEGTRHTVDFAQRVGIKNFHYVSTAYVGGCREDLCREDELDVGQKFRNDYEHSKLLAEKLVREATGFEKTTVYRPAIIAGDSVTGYTNTYHGLFAYLKLICLLVRNTPPQPDGRIHTPLRMNITGDEPRNIVPVDWVSACLTHLFCTPAAHGGTYNLAPEHRMTAKDMIDAGYTYFNSYGIEYGGNVTADTELNNFEKHGYSSVTKATYEPYEANDPLFDTTNLRKFTPHLPCPEIDEAMIHRYWKFGEENRWGKRKQPKLKVDFWVGDYLAQQWTAGEKSPAKTNGHRQSNGNVKQTPLTVSLRVIGPGGGDWTLQIAEGKLVAFAPGLPQQASCRLEMDTTDFVSLVQGETMTPTGVISEQGNLNHETVKQVAKVLFATASAPSLSAAGS